MSLSLPTISNPNVAILIDWRVLDDLSDLWPAAFPSWLQMDGAEQRFQAVLGVF
jgi:hypothetical protein